MQKGHLTFSTITVFTNIPARSLTTPPCSENVLWHISTEPLSVNIQQYNAVKMMLKFNSRKSLSLGYAMFYGSKDMVTTAPSLITLPSMSINNSQVWSHGWPPKIRPLASDDNIHIALPNQTMD
jgi:hypothetical protein